MPHASAATSRNAEDASLRGRTYDIPFEDVWQGALRVARERLRGWAVDLTDDENGRISVDVRSRLRSLTGIVRWPPSPRSTEYSAPLELASSGSWASPASPAVAVT